MGALNLAQQLGWKDFPRQFLLTLDLTGNNIGSKGAKYFADALRWNRTLKRLILTGNKIRSSGAKELGSIFMPFLLTKKENELRQTRYWKRMKILNLCVIIKDYLFLLASFLILLPSAEWTSILHTVMIGDRMDKLVKTMFRSWISDNSEAARTYNDYQKELFDFRIRSELTDIFGRSLVTAMENYCSFTPSDENEEMKWIHQLLTDADRAEKRISSGMDSSDAASRSSASEHIPPTFISEDDSEEVLTSESVIEIEDNRKHSDRDTITSVHSSSESLLAKQKSLTPEVDVGLLQDQEMSELKQILSREISRDCKDEIKLSINAPVDSSDVEKCSVTSTSDTGDSTSTWSSYGMLPGRAADGSDFEDLSDEEFMEVFCDIKEIVEYINTPDVNQGELYEHEVCMIYKKLYHEAEKTVPPDLHPMMKGVKEYGSKSWCCGNYVLKHINLSYNKIGKKGLKQFLKVFEYRNQHEKLKDKMLAFIFT
uniref:Uncharacterized protein n=1 Tax=Rhodnius prolixus TaxID=13249 RepID=T1HSK2_RHOPR